MNKGTNFGAKDTQDKKTQVDFYKYKKS